MKIVKSELKLSSGIVRWLITSIFLGAFVIYFILNANQFRPLLNIDLWMLLLIAMAEAMFLVSNGLLTQFILRPFGKVISLVEATYVALITSVGNFFAPVGAGLAFRAVYLKRRHQVQYSDYISIVAGNYIIVLLVNSLFGLLALYLLRSRADSHYHLLVATMVFLLVFSLALIFLRVPDKAKEAKSINLRRLFKLLAKLSDGWQRIADNKLLLLQLILITIANLLITAVIYWLIIRSLGWSVGASALLLFSVFSVLSLFLNVTPANIGVKEAIYIFSAHVLGFSVSQIILIALIERSVFFIMMLAAYLILKTRGNYAF